jgi:hypothetical protein
LPNWVKAPPRATIGGEAVGERSRPGWRAGRLGSLLLDPDFNMIHLSVQYAAHARAYYNLLRIRQRYHEPAPVKKKFADDEPLSPRRPLSVM